MIWDLYCEKANALFGNMKSFIVTSFFLTSYHWCKGSVVSPTCPQADTWSEDSVSAGNPEHSDNAQLRLSRISGEAFQIRRCFGLLVVDHMRLLEDRLTLNSVPSLIPAVSKKPNNPSRTYSHQFILLTCAFLAGICQMIVAGNVTPATTIVPHHHHAVFTRQEVAVWLASVPVLVQLRAWK